MHAVSVSGLKHNPAEALRQAKSSPVVVLNRDHPDAVLIGLEQGGVLQAPGVRAALATALAATQDRLAAAAIARDPAAFTTLLSGRVGVGIAYDTLRRLRAWCRGKRFDAAHGGGREEMT